VIQRYAIAAAVLGLVAVALWRPARAPVVQTVATAAPDQSPPAEGRRRHRLAGVGDGGELVVYVAGAVKRPGLYRLHEGDRDAQAVALAGGFTTAADAGGVNLAQRASDGDEVYVPALGESTGPRSERRSRRRPAARPELSSVDINRSGAAALAAVPGIGRAIAERIVELRAREGNFASLDELLDVAGMTQSRLERARPYLLAP